MFRPMAVTVCSALFGSLLLALTVIPALATVIFRRRHSRTAGISAIPQWAEFINRSYSRTLEWTLDHRYLTVSAAMLVLLIGVLSLFSIGTEFMPKLDE